MDLWFYNASWCFWPCFWSLTSMCAAAEQKRAVWRFFKIAPFEKNNSICFWNSIFGKIIRWISFLREDTQSKTQIVTLKHVCTDRMALMFLSSPPSPVRPSAAAVSTGEGDLQSVCLRWPSVAARWRSPGWCGDDTAANWDQNKGACVQTHRTLPDLSILT